MKSIGFDNGAPEPDLPAYFAIAFECAGIDVEPGFKPNFSAVAADMVSLKGHSGAILKNGEGKFNQKLCFLNQPD